MIISIVCCLFVLVGIVAVFVGAVQYPTQHIELATLEMFFGVVCLGFGMVIEYAKRILAAIEKGGTK